MKEDDTSVHFNNANVTATDSISRRRSFDKATLPAAHPARVFPLARKPSFSSADSERSFSRPGLQVHSHGRSVRCHDRTRRSEQSSFCIYVAAPIHTYTRHRVHMYSKRSRPSRLVVAQTLMTSLSLIRIPIVAAAVSTGTPLHLLQLLFPSSAVLRAEKKKQIPVEKRGRRSPPSLATRLCPDFSFPLVRCGAATSNCPPSDAIYDSRFCVIVRIFACSSKHVESFATTFFNGARRCVRTDRTRRSAINFFVAFG